MLLLHFDPTLVCVEHKLANFAQLSWLLCHQYTVREMGAQISHISAQYIYRSAPSTTSFLGVIFWIFSSQICNPATELCSLCSYLILFAEIVVKGDPDTGVLGDCTLNLPSCDCSPHTSCTVSDTLDLPYSLPSAGPYSHRALLTLEEKHVPYTKVMVDLDNKPQWLFDVNPAGSVPVLKELATGKWTPDSGVICNMMEELYPEPSLGTVEGSPQVGIPIFSAFKDFAKSGPDDAGAKEAALVEALDELESYLKTHGGPYIGGAQPCATDALQMPRLYQIAIALKHFRGWEMPARFESIRAYMDAFMARDSWKNTYYSPELVIKGWVRHGLEVKK